MKSIMMNTPKISTLITFILLFIFSCSFVAYADNNQADFIECLTEEFDNYTSISNLVYTQANSSYTSVLRTSLQNLRFASDSTPKPQVIITPVNESQVPPIVYCAKRSDLQIRTRSGGHDHEGLSYVSPVPFVIVDLINLSEVTVDVEQKTAWVQAGANIGTLYYRIAEQSPVLGYPAGICPTVGVGGHFSGGGHGTLKRKYGLAADNVIDARIVNVNGKILDRKSMGEGLFWAIRGGGGASFGVVLAWKVQLVDVPETVTVFTIRKTLEQNATQLLDRWQYIGNTFDRDLYMRVILTRTNSSESPRNMTVVVAFNSIFFGGVDTLLPVMEQSFPELGLTREDCTEMSWIESILYFPEFRLDSIEGLLNRTQPDVRYFKATSDYIQKPVPEHVLRGMFRRFFEAEAEEAVLVLNPYGGRMAEISPSAIPFPHRKGNLYSILYWVYWREENAGNSDRYIDWIRRFFRYMTPYVSKNPRGAYINYRDLDLGVNNDVGPTSYAQASTWGFPYFKKANFDRLVRVKTRVDPRNFFRNEQSIPPVHSSWSSM